MIEAEHHDRGPVSQKETDFAFGSPFAEAAESSSEDIGPMYKNRYRRRRSKETE